MLKDSNQWCFTLFSSELGKSNYINLQPKTIFITTSGTSLDIFWYKPAIKLSNRQDQIHNGTSMSGEK
jgi:hypothetical protein